jgi:HK97 gp10 family phage protein
MINITINLPKNVAVTKTQVDEGLRKGVNRITAEMTKASQVNAPYKFGNLRRSIHAEVAGMGGFTGKVIQDTGVAKYGPYVHFGTGLYGPEKREIIIKPANKKALFWKGAAHPVKSVKVKGMKPRPFMKKAFDEKKGEAPDIVREEILREVKA